MGGGRKQTTGRKSVNTYNEQERKNRLQQASYPVTMLVDLQVYVVPREKWVLCRRLYRHNIVEEGISLGFVRVLPQLSIHNLRRELQLQLGPDLIPRDFIFVRAVGNIFIQLKPKQEVELKVKNFIPPFSPEPEIYVLEVLPNEDPRLISPLPLLIREDTPPHICHELCHHSLARRPVHVTSKRQQRGDESPQPTTPFPPISITPSPTPFSESASYNPDDYKDLIEEYNRELSENHLSKSRAEIVARQAAYDDIEITRSDPGTTAATGRTSVSPRVLTRGGGGSGGSAPCPYCSSSESIKSEASFQTLTLDRAASVVSLINKRNASSKRGTTHTSPSTDRNTESPSSVDTVNTVIQSKAYDILGELKQQDEKVRDNFDIASTLDDSFESIDSVQDLVIKEDIQNGSLSSELTGNQQVIVEAESSMTLSNASAAAVTPSTTPTSPKGENSSTSPLTQSPSPSSFQREHDYSYAQEERNLDSLYEEEEEEEEEEERNEKALDEIFPPQNLTDTEENDILKEKDEVVKNEACLESKEPCESTNLDDACDDNTSLAQQDVLCKAEETNSMQQQVEESKQEQVEESKQEQVATVVSQLSEKIEDEQNAVTQPVSSGDRNVQHDNAIIHAADASEPKCSAEVTSTVTTGKEKENVSEEQEGVGNDKEDDTEVNGEKEVPVTEEPGNEEVTIIVTQDDMPPANISDSDEEQDKHNTETEKPEQESLNNAKSPVESTTSDNGETESESQQQEQLPQNPSIEQQEDQSQEIPQLQQPKPNGSTEKSNFYEEEVITKVIHEDAVKNSDSSYYDNHHELSDSYYNVEKIEDSFSQHAYEEHSMNEKALDVSEHSYELSEKNYNYEKDFETESGYEDFDRSFQESSSHYDNHHQHNFHNGVPINGRMGEPRIHRQHTFADIPPLPVKKTLLIRKQKTEDFTSSSTISTIPLSKKKPKPYPDPRKPAVYPQRLNKTTLARQALAREKRRIYIEERIQNFMRNTKSIQTPYGSLDRSFSVERSNHKTLNSSSFSLSKISGDSKSKYEKLHHLSSTISHHRPNHDSLTQISYRKSKIQSPQSLPDISIIDYYMAPSRGLLTSTPVSQSKTKLSSSHKSHHLSSSMSSIRSPTVGVAEVSVVSGGGAGGGGGATPRSGVVIDSIPEETSDFWNAISSEEGYFYTFRVRQTGPVQMLDKAVQTQSGPMNFSRDFYTSFPRKRAPPLNNKSSTITLPLIDDRDKILREIAETVQLRHDAELRRAELIQRANDLQTLIKEKRDKINRRHEFWHKKYIEESSMTRPLEAACNSLRAELNTVHRRLLAHLEGRDLPLRLRDGPSKKANYKIMAARLQHEIKELQQKAKAAKLRLESEIKLKEQAEREVRELRNDLAHKKVIMSLARSQIAALPSVHPRGYDHLGY